MTHCGNSWKDELDDRDGDAWVSRARAAVRLAGVLRVPPCRAPLRHPACSPSVRPLARTLLLLGNDASHAPRSIPVNPSTGPRLQASPPAHRSRAAARDPFTGWDPLQAVPRKGHRRRCAHPLHIDAPTVSHGPQRPRCALPIRGRRARRASRTMPCLWQEPSALRSLAGCGAASHRPALRGSRWMTVRRSRV